MNMHEFLAELDLVPKGKKFADRPEWSGEFTAMQEEVVKQEAFWDQNQNIVIHGPTSSGKTLLAEIAALHQIQEEGNKVLFLVPLRVLVTSQCRQLQRDFEQIQTMDGKSLDIFESSADYQDHDAQILNGEYDIGVIVYEKFFAMLNNSPNHMLDHCGLIVVDELQMLSSTDRGPKMEFSIMKVLEEQQAIRARGQSNRIIGMTTSESGVDRVCSWLHAESLGNDIRPVSLNQYFVSCRSSTAVHLGEIWCRKIPSSAEQVQDNDPQNGCLDIPPVVKQRGRDQNTVKNRCFFALLNKWMEPKSDTENNAKILIFSNAKSSVCFLAKEIRKKYPLFTGSMPADEKKRLELRDAMNAALHEFSDEEDINDLSTLIPHGIAFHHSGLPSTVREAIEEDFRSNSGRIQVIVCTETLMIGVNLPTDVVILYDNTVYRGEPVPRKLTLQEYKNFIGRAGRLGMNTHGESYMLTDQLRNDFKIYTSDRKTEIVSPFNADCPMEIAPYFMNWIGHSADAEQRIHLGLKQGFCCNQHEQVPQNMPSFVTGILDTLKMLRKENTDGTMLSLVKENNTGLKSVWTLTQLGGYLSPYALTLNTDAILLNYVIHHRNNLNMKALKLEVSPNKEPIPTTSLLELLYTICQCVEVDKNPVLKLPPNDDRFRDLGKNLKKYLRRIYPVCPRVCTDTQERSLAQIAHAESVLEDKETRAATRAVILALWMAGCKISFIRKNTSFNLSISTSDVERLSEVVAYLMEAMSNCEKALDMDESDIRGMYALSTSMKYGVPRALIPLANTHVRGVTRPFLLKIGEVASEAGKTPVEYVLASMDKKYVELQKVLRARKNIPNYAQQIENRTMQIDDRFNSLLTVLKGLDFAFTPDAILIYGSLKEFFEKLCDISTQDDAGIQVHEPYSQRLQVQFIYNGQIRQLYFQTLHPVLSDNNSWVDSVRIFDQYVAQQAKTANIPNTRAITVLCGVPPIGAEELSDDQLVISSEMLGVLLLACLLENTCATKDLICRILSDLQGNFILNGSGFFSEYGQLWELVTGYSMPMIYPTDDHLQLFYYPGIFDSNRSILSTSRKYTALPWGREESAGKYKRAAFYHPAMWYSRQSRITLQKSNIVCCSADDAQQVHMLVSNPGIIYVKNFNDKMDTLLCDFAERLTTQQPNYEYYVGISFRGQYEQQMKTLYQELVQRRKDILCMNTDTFEKRMVGDDIPTCLRREFSRCRHIIVCDTFDYDQSPYTMAEYYVILDKLCYALQEGQSIPVYLVQIPGVERSQKLSNFFRFSHHHSYDQNNISDLVDKLMNQMMLVDQNNQNTKCFLGK